MGDLMTEFLDPVGLEYTSLDSRDLRFLKIHSGTFEDDVSCDILILDRDTRPKYTAISYTWGSDYQKSHKIRIAGCEFLVGGNCLYAIRQARHFLEEGSLVWIDAICINQIDLEEKAIQVSLMSETYRQAETILACIGQMGSMKSELIDLMSRQSGEFERLWASTRGADECALCLDARIDRSERDICHVTHHWIATTNSDQIYSLYDAAEIMSASPYWTRLWVVQETVASTKVRVLCDLTMVWMHFLHALSIVKQHFTGNERALSEFAQNCGHDLSKRPGLLQARLAVKMFRMCNYSIAAGHEDISHMDPTQLGCTDPRDRIYGLLHMQSWPKSTGPPTPSYNKSRLEVATDYFHHRALTVRWTQEISSILNILTIPDEDCWEEVRSRLYIQDQHALPSTVTPNASQKCARHVLPGRFRITGARQCYRILKDEHGSLVTHLQLGAREKARDRFATYHCCPSIEQYNDLQTLLHDQNGPKKHGVFQILGKCKEGDLLLGSEPINFSAHRSLPPPYSGLQQDFAFVLRKSAVNYYKVVGFSVNQKVAYCQLGSACRSMSCESDNDSLVRQPRFLELYSTIDDAIQLILHVYALDHLRPCVERPGHGYIHLAGHRTSQVQDYPVAGDLGFRFPVRKWSAYGVPLQMDDGVHQEHPHLAGVPSLDASHIPCASCGVLFRPAAGGKDDEPSGLPGICVDPHHRGRAMVSPFVNIPRRHALIF